MRFIKGLRFYAFYKAQEELIIEEDTDYQLDFYNLHLLVRSLNNILNRKGMKEKEMDMGEITREEHSIIECMDNILDKLKFKSRIKFTDLLKANTSRSEIVAYFLSLLELIKRKDIYVVQDEAFIDLFIDKRNNEEQ